MRKTIIAFMVILFTVLMIKLAMPYYYFIKIKNSDKVTRVRAILGEPTHTYIYEKTTFNDVYHLSLSKMVFTYSKKDSLLLSKWKEN